MTACSPNLVANVNFFERIQRLSTRLVTGIRHLPYEERLSRLGLHSLPGRRLWVAFRICTGLLGVEIDLLFLPPTRRGLSAQTLRETPRKEPLPERGSAFSVSVVDLSSRLRRYSVFCQVFQAYVRESLDGSFSPLTEVSLPQFPYFPPNCTPSINSLHLCMLPKSVSFRPVVVMTTNCGVVNKGMKARVDCHLGVVLGGAL